MNVRNCKKCGRIFTYIAGEPLCPSCRELMEERFQKVKEHIQNNKDTTIRTVSEECEVEEGQIRQWVREERLVFAEGSSIGVECESCGTLIRTGRFCDRCKAEMVRTLSSAGRQRQAAQEVKRPTRDSAKMRFLDDH